MNSLIKSLFGLITLGAIALPTKALTEQEIFLIASCFSNQGCYRGYHYPKQPYSRYQYSFPYSHPRVIIVPAQPQYRYTPPYSGYYFNQDHNRFRQHDRGYSDYDYYYGGYRQQDVRGQINQIYRNILGRDADIDGLNTYQDRYNSGWSLIDIQRDIANSQEARSIRRF